MNWAVGIVGEKINGSFLPLETDGIIENMDVRILPRYLYLKQLEERAGSAAVDAVTIPA